MKRLNSDSTMVHVEPTRCAPGPKMKHIFIHTYKSLENFLRESLHVQCNTSCYLGRGEGVKEGAIICFFYMLHSMSILLLHS